MVQHVLVPVSDGSEELEAVTVIDVLRRAGLEVRVMGVVPEELEINQSSTGTGTGVGTGTTVNVYECCTCSRGIKIVPDVWMERVVADNGDMWLGVGGVKLTEYVETFDAICVPGGMPGADHLGKAMGESLKHYVKTKGSSGVLAAICAAPARVLNVHGLLEGVSKTTCHPGFVSQLASNIFSEDRVCVSKSSATGTKIITSRGPGTALEFALQVVEELLGKKDRDDVATPMVPLPSLLPADSSSSASSNNQEHAVNAGTHAQGNGNGNGNGEQKRQKTHQEMGHKILVPITNGSEEIEFISVVDTLRRAGASVTVAKVATSNASEASNATEASKEPTEDKLVTCSRKVMVIADDLLENLSAKEFDAIAIPGGKGAIQLGESARLREFIQELMTKATNERQNCIIAAVCAAPAVVLHKNGFLEQVNHFTSHPSVEKKMPKEGYSLDRVCVAPGPCNEQVKFITSRGPGTSLEFALEIVQHMFGEEKRNKVAAPMLVANM